MIALALALALALASYFQKGMSTYTAENNDGKDCGNFGGFEAASEETK